MPWFVQFRQSWSVFPAWTLYHSLEYFMDIALLATVLVMVRTADEYKSVMDWVWLVYGAGMVLVWIEAILMPQLAFQPPTHRLGRRISHRKLERSRHDGGSP